MKYGEHLKANVAPEYGPDVYLAYEKLDEIIQVLSSMAPSGYVALLILTSCALVLRESVKIVQRDLLYALLYFI